MIVRKINDNVYVVVPEDSDDLLSLRRIVRKDDQITVNTTRVVKQVREFARPDRGERVSVRVVLRVEKVSLDSAVDRLRINGVILNSNNELVPRGVSHSHAIRVGDPLSIEKTIWTELDSTILNKGSTQSFVLISIDRTEVAVGRIAGTHLKMIPNVYSGFSGKMYKMKEENVDSYFNDIIKILLNVKDEDDHIVIFGPGDVKRRFHNYLINNTKVNQQNVRVVDGIDVAGQDGIYVFLRSTTSKDAIGSSKLAIVSLLLNEVMRRIHMNDNRIAMGFKEVYGASKFNAIEALMFSDSVFKNAAEDVIIDLLNTAEVHGAKIFALDSSTDMGMQVSSLGGMVALLRYVLH